MNFRKKGEREAKRKVVKDVQKKFNHYLSQVDYYGQIAHLMSQKYRKGAVTDENITKILNKEGFNDIDKFGELLILGQLDKNYE